MAEDKGKSMKLSIWEFGVSVGIVMALGMLFAGWAAVWGWCTLFVNTMSTVFVGYTPSFGGGIVGAIWGFISGFIGGALLAFFYSLFCCRKK